MVVPDDGLADAGNAKTDRSDHSRPCRGKECQRRGWGIGNGEEEEGWAVWEGGPPKHERRLDPVPKLASLLFNDPELNLSRGQALKTETAEPVGKNIHSMLERPNTTRNKQRYARAKRITKRTRACATPSRSRNKQILPREKGSPRLVETLWAVRLQQQLVIRLRRFRFEADHIFLERCIGSDQPVLDITVFSHRSPSTIPQVTVVFG